MHCNYHENTPHVFPYSALCAAGDTRPTACGFAFALWEQEDRAFFPFPCASAILTRETPIFLTKENYHARTHCLGRVAGSRSQRQGVGGRRKTGQTRCAPLVAG